MDDTEISGGVSAADREAWARRILLVLFATWLISGAVALVSFRLEWERWPPLWDAVMGLTLLAPLALPMSLAQTLGGRNIWRGVQMLLLVIGYWGFIAGLVVLAYKRRSKLPLMLVFAISVTAAVRWLYLAGGMLGI